MTKDNPNPEQPDPLSATGMFLRAFDVEGEKKPSDPFAPAPAAPRPPNAASERPPYPSAPPPRSAGQGTDHSEFTQMFNSQGQGQRPAPPPAQPATEAPTAVFRAPSYPGPSPAPADQPPGEFTRIFVSGVTPPQAAPSRSVEDPPRPAPLSSATFLGSVPSSGSSRAKGFSSPGISDSAEGGFTQFFSAPARPASPPQSAAPPTPPPPRVQPAPDNSWRDDPFFRAPEKTSAPEQPSQSVTSILSSLSSPAGSGSRAPEPAPYRPEPMPSYAPPKPSESSPADPGGVTRLIQRLAQEQSAPAAPPPYVPDQPAESGPGEFTRIMSAPSTRPAMGAPPASAPPPPAPLFAAPPPPPMPKIAPPPFAPPSFAAPPPAAPHSPAFAAPPVPAFAAPAVPMPKPAPPPPVPALAPPKSKLEAMVPILLVINTFLLLLLLMVVIFLIKSK